MKLGVGAVVCGGVHLSTNLLIGRHAHVNPGAIIGHDSVLEDVRGLTVGREVVVGAGACVTRNVSRGTVVKDVPAR